MLQYRQRPELLADTHFEIELDNQIVHAGERVSGRIRATGPFQADVKLSLQGEEVLAGTAHSYVLPVVDQSLEVGAQAWSDAGLTFEFDMPHHCPPTYASPDIRCQYFVKLNRRLSLFDRLRAKSVQLLGIAPIERYHITVLPPEVPAEAKPEFFVLKDAGLQLEAQIDRSCLNLGQSLTGELLLSLDGDRTPETHTLPTKLTFRLAAIEESVEPGHDHRKVLWLVTHDVCPTPDMTYPFRGMFEFPIPLEAPFCGEWTTFRVHYGFRVGMMLPGGGHVRESLPIVVYRNLQPRH